MMTVEEFAVEFEKGDVFTNWNVVGAVPEEFADEFIETLADLFPQHTVGLFRWLSNGYVLEDEAVYLRIRPALRPLQLASWSSVFRRLAHRHGIELSCCAHHG